VFFAYSRPVPYGDQVKKKLKVSYRTGRLRISTKVFRRRAAGGLRG